METDSLLLGGIILLLLLLFSTIFAYVVYSGLFVNIEVKTCKPPFESLTVAYKFALGPYRNSSKLFTQVHSLVPDLDCFGVYYDDPHRVSPGGLRYSVGVIVENGSFHADEQTKQLLQNEGYKLATFPSVDHVVMSSFPFNGTLSIMIAVARVYPHLGEYIRERKLCAYPFVEIYGKNEILFVAPLSRQEEFYVPEAMAPVESDPEEEIDVEEEMERLRSTASVATVSSSEKDDGKIGKESREPSPKLDSISQKSSTSSFEELHLESS